MFDFVDVRAVSKTEQIRAWSVEKAVETVVGLEVTDEEIVRRSAAIEQFILKGAESNA